MTKRQQLWAGIVVLVFAILLGAASFACLWQVYVHHRLERDGVTASARVTDTRTSRSRSSSPTDYHVAYEFDAGNGKTEMGRDHIGEANKEHWEQARLTKAITVRYLPDNPSVNGWEKASADHKLINSILAGVLGLLTMFAAGCGVWALREARNWPAS